MSYNARVESKTNSISFYAFSAPLVLLLFVSNAVQGFPHVSTTVSPPSVIQAIETVKPIYNSLPVARTVIPKQVKTPVKAVKQNVVIVAPRAVLKKPEARLIIPSIKVNAVIKDMGVTMKGAMAVPDNRIDVGWYSSGTRPGAIGSAVVGGHNRWDDAVAVFDRLDELKIGDVLSVVDAKGETTSFVVREMRTFDATDLDSGIFESVSGIHLNLITCSGVWSPKTNSYTTRLVIFTDLAV